jgi:hypothetical protein
MSATNGESLPTISVASLLRLQHYMDTIGCQAAKTSHWDEGVVRTAQHTKDDAGKRSLPEASLRYRAFVAPSTHFAPPNRITSPLFPISHERIVPLCHDRHESTKRAPDSSTILLIPGREIPTTFLPTNLTATHHPSPPSIISLALAFAFVLSVVSC